MNESCNTTEFIPQNKYRFKYFLFLFCFLENVQYKINYILIAVCIYRGKIKMTFADWVDTQGGRIAVAKKLDVSPQAVHYWFHGKSAPRWRTLMKIKKLSKGKIKPFDVYAWIAGRSR